jgi:hypothetical protein
MEASTWDRIKGKINQQRVSMGMGREIKAACLPMLSTRSIRKEKVIGEGERRIGV